MLLRKSMWHSQHHERRIKHECIQNAAERKGWKCRNDGMETLGRYGLVISSITNLQICNLIKVRQNSSLTEMSKATLSISIQLPRYIWLRTTIETPWAIWYYLHKFKNVKNIHGEVLLLGKFQALASQFMNVPFNAIFLINRRMNWEYFKACVRYFLSNFYFFTKW